MSGLSVLVIAKNEADCIAKCLASVRFADELIVLDSGSTDDTVAICKQFTDKVYETDWPGFGKQRQRAIAKATQEWVLFLDADEYLTPELQQEIQTTLDKVSPGVSLFKIPRRTLFYGKQIKHANGKELLPRLVRRSQAIIGDECVHESINAHGNSAKLKQIMLHETATSIDEMLDKLNSYTSLAAKSRIDNNPTQLTSTGKAIRHGLWMFIRVYLLNLGFLDGKEGFILALYFAENSYYRYLKMHYELYDRHTSPAV